jgi:4-amino-4-deoxy-L-arabinose transferase-like glycosyltransferase
MMKRRWFLIGALVFAALLASRMCYVDVLWVDEAYGMAAAARLERGEALYRDIWFDKPPLYAYAYWPWGTRMGWPLRLGEAVFSLLCCALAALAARRLFGEAEAKVAALLMAFFLIFGHPSATVPLAPDLLAVPFALGCIWAAASGRPLLAGAIAGAALAANSKAVFLLPLLLLWHYRAAGRVLAGWVGMLAAGAGWLATQGALTDHLQQVWRWGWLYSRDTFLADPIAEGLRRTANWAGFHAALVVGAAVYAWRERNANTARIGIWLSGAALGVAAGWRFFPRYFLTMLPVMTLAAARGLMLLSRRARVLLLCATLLVPAARFGARHLTMARQALTGSPPVWSDLAMFEDCRSAARILAARARPQDTLFVWGYRPELNVLAAMPAGTRFLDSQPLTGVLADRHLRRADATAPELAAANRQALGQSRPTFVVDGLGPFNPALAIGRYVDLQAWLAHYELIGETTGTRIYRRRGDGLSGRR